MNQHDTELIINYTYTRELPSKLQNYVYTKFHMDILKKFIGVAEVVVRREGNAVNVNLKFSKYSESYLRDVGDVLRYEYSIEIPICLHSHKNSIERELESISKNTGAVITLQIIRKVNVVINGNNEEAKNAREQSIFLISRLLGNSFYGKSGINFKLKKSRIFHTESSHNIDYSSAIEIPVSRLKFSCLLFYYRESIENLLASSDSLLIFSDESENSTIKIASNSKINQLNCERSLMLMYSSIIRLDSSYRIYNSSSSNIIVINNMISKRSSIVGQIESISPCIHPELDIYVEFNVDVEIGDFLCGKKCGKINKISKATNCQVKISQSKQLLKPTLIGSNNRNDMLQDHNLKDKIDDRVNFVNKSINNPNNLKTQDNLMQFEIKGPGKCIIQCLKMFRDEFPVEMSFFVDKKHHKKIIGVCGKTIQKIMKKYDVYVRFMNYNESAGESLAGNVIMKTPRKNESNLEKIKQEIYEMANISRDIFIPVKASLFLPKNIKAVEEGYNYSKIKEANYRYFEIGSNKQENKYDDASMFTIQNQQFVFSASNLFGQEIETDHWNMKKPTEFSKKEQDELPSLLNLLGLINNSDYIKINSFFY